MTPFATLIASVLGLYGSLHPFYFITASFLFASVYRPRKKERQKKTPPTVDLRCNQITVFDWLEQWSATQRGIHSLQKHTSSVGSSARSSTAND